ncbi:hypothetical protein THZG08_340025 [Vibrio owensii]|nr:hypothetical protein THZG08_340025 [Vibrio owensii]CAH1558189.1 hypothetical protein THZB04_100128 [Vibrio owensii]CAH1569859.1 hypothetical protein THOD04_120140 [Vibrio owensii]CAH1572290.1 hypothetical protein THOA03_340025 [Vibrio owensii]
MTSSRFKNAKRIQRRQSARHYGTSSRISFFYLKHYKMSVAEQPDKFYISSRNTSLNGLIPFVNQLASLLRCCVCKLVFRVR